MFVALAAINFAELNHYCNPATISTYFTFIFILNTLQSDDCLQMDIIKGLQVHLYEVSVGDLTNFDIFIIVCTCRNSSWVYFKTSQHFDTIHVSKWNGTEFYLYLNITFLPRKRRMMKKMLMRSLNYFLKMKSGCKCTALTVSHFRMTFFVCF